tara:strand:+ start:768 stop:1079 length:312 start_codon:yes stop_codon:yes gene_type:complete
MAANDTDYQIQATKRLNDHTVRESIGLLNGLDRDELINLCARLMTKACDMGDAATSARRPGLSAEDVDGILAGIQYMAGDARAPRMAADPDFPGSPWYRSESA